jgi:cob(I)alamin adenosyltransferase
MSDKKQEKIGIIQVITGDGRGKTTSALGTAVRAVGYGHRVIILQFIKGDWYYGEQDGIKRLAPEVEFEKCGLGFYKIMDDDKPEELHKKAAADGLRRASEAIKSGKYNLVILDEINNAIHEGLLKATDVTKILRNKPETVHIILTGRDAHREILEVADMVSEIRDVKHPFKKGILAQRGFDY